MVFDKGSDNGGGVGANVSFTHDLADRLEQLKSEFSLSTLPLTLLNLAESTTSPERKLPPHKMENNDPLVDARREISNRSHADDTIQNVRVTCRLGERTWKTSSGKCLELFS